MITIARYRSQVQVRRGSDYSEHYSPAHGCHHISPVCWSIEGLYCSLDARL